MQDQVSCEEHHAGKATVAGAMLTINNFPLTTAVSLEPKIICPCRRVRAMSISSLDMKCTCRNLSPFCRGLILWQPTPSAVFNSCFRSCQQTPNNRTQSRSAASLTTSSTERKVGKT